MESRYVGAVGQSLQIGISNARGTLGLVGIALDGMAVPNSQARSR